MSSMNFIQSVFQNRPILKYLFYFQTRYEESYWFGDMNDFLEYDIQDKDVQENLNWYLTKHILSQDTKWLFTDQEDNLYGIWKNFVILCDNEGSFFYFCKQFHNLPFVLFQNKLPEIQDKMKLSSKRAGFDYDRLMDDYKKLCQSYDYSVDTYDYTLEYESEIEKAIEQLQQK